MYHKYFSIFKLPPSKNEIGIRAQGRIKILDMTLLWIFYGVFSILCLLCLLARLFICASGHLLGKGWPHGSRLWCLNVTLSLYHWYPVSGVVLDCIGS